MMVHKIITELNKTLEHLNALYKMVGSNGTQETRMEIFEVSKMIREIASKASNSPEQNLDEDKPEDDEQRRLDI